MGVMDGVKVVEVAEHGFVPSAAAILADWGADVVKVERPTGDPLRRIMAMGFVADTGDFNFLFEQFNRNKRGVAIDLRIADGRAALDRLIEWADVFITNFLPSARTKLKLDPDDIWAVNPKAVYAIGSGQGLQGPDADQGGFDAVSYWARGGLAHMLAGIATQRRGERAPRHVAMRVRQRPCRHLAHVVVLVAANRFGERVRCTQHVSGFAQSPCRHLADVCIRIGTQDLEQQRDLRGIDRRFAIDENLRVAAEDAAHRRRRFAYGDLADRA